MHKRVEGPWVKLKVYVRLQLCWEDCGVPRRPKEKSSLLLVSAAATRSAAAAATGCSILLLLLLAWDTSVANWVSREPNSIPCTHLLHGPCELEEPRGLQVFRRCKEEWVSGHKLVSESVKMTAKETKEKNYCKPLILCKFCLQLVKGRRKSSSCVADSSIDSLRLRRRNIRKWK